MHSRGHKEGRSSADVRPAAVFEREELARDLAWMAFAQDRIEHPTSAPVGWDEAQRRRHPDR
jgi:hypothetical protein